MKGRKKIHSFAWLVGRVLVVRDRAAAAAVVVRSLQNNLSVPVRPDCLLTQAVLKEAKLQSNGSAYLKGCSLDLNLVKVRTVFPMSLCGVA